MEPRIAAAGTETVSDPSWPVAYSAAVNVATSVHPGRALSARYVLHERLGAGGQGEVWRARDHERGADLALKILQPPPGRSAVAWDALVHEHDSVSGLDHPHILKVYPPEREDGTFLLPMELAAGGDLRRLRGSDYLTVVPVLIEIAQALEHAHQNGVIHRDLKPANVLFDSRGSVKVADFGVSGRTPAAGRDTRGLSPFAASPEQLRGEPPATADDIYGLGALAYELLSSHPPHYPRFDARRAQHEPVPPLVPADPMPPRLDRLIARMLARDARDRPPGMRDVIEELEIALTDTLTFDFDTELVEEPPPPAPQPTARTSAVAPSPAPVAAAPMAAVAPSPAPVAAAPVAAVAPSPAPPPAENAPVLITFADDLRENDSLRAELQHTRVPGPRLEPMRSVLPRVLLALVAAAGAAVLSYTLLSRYFTGALPLRLPGDPPAAAATRPIPDNIAPAAAPRTAAGTSAADQRRPTDRAVKTGTEFGDDAYAVAAGEGFAALGAGRLDEARAAFERAQALRPNGPEAADGLRRVAAALQRREAAEQRAEREAR
jgi:serine/threonine-protein kinase